MELEFDLYTRSARLKPVLLVLFPVGLTITALFVRGLSGWVSLVGLLTPFGLAPLFAQMGRDLGKRKESVLFAMWGGKSTTRMLRHRNTELNPFTKARYHSRLRTALPDLGIPGPEEEAADTERADQIFESCASFLKQRARDEKRGLLLAENMNYGYRRNLWAMKPAGMTLALSGTVVCALAVIDSASHGDLSLIALGAAAVSAVLTVWWLVRINPTWVRLAADEYARRLLETCEGISAPEPPKIVPG